jgi:putative SOS response-associated peptidase YedK
MCYNYNVTIYNTITEFEDEFDAKFKDKNIIKNIDDYYYVSAYNFPRLPVITNDEPYNIQLFNWGLIPFWIKTKDDAKKIRNQTLNARAETIFEKPSFRYSIKEKRCLVPACGFFEWRYILGRNYPYYIFLKHRKYFSFAGLWDSWYDKKSDETISSYTIITCEANNLLKKIHNKKKRMPVILPKDIERRWIDNTMSISDIKSFLIPYADEEMKAYTISRLVTSKTQNRNVPEVIKPYNYPELKNII